MNTWICRILSFVFFVNCLPVQAWADSQRSARRRNRALEEQVARQVEQYPYDQWKAEVAELEGVLQSDDLTPEERQFAQLELDSAKLRVEHIEVLGDSTDIAGTNNAYAARIDVLEAKKEALEKQVLIRSFYQMAQSDKMIAASVYAMHKAHKDGLSRVAQAQTHSDQILNAEWIRRGRNPEGDDMLLAPVREAEAQRQRALDIAVENQLTLQPSSLRVATPLPTEPIALSPDVAQIRETLLDRWAKNTITVEELVEYADPVDTADISFGNIAAAAELLFYIFYGYNLQVAQLDQENLDSAIWLAKRIQFRAQHQLHELEVQARDNQSSSLPFVQARGNLMRLQSQVQQFLSTNKDTASGSIDESRLQELDQQLPEYAQIKRDLAGYRANMWSVSNVGAALSKDVQEAYKQNPSADSRASTLLSQQLAYVVVYLTSTGNIYELSKLVAMVNTDGETFHGKNEPYVSTIFASIFDAMINYATSEQTQKNIRALIWNAARPMYNDKPNAVNVRVQALAVASMLRMAAKPADDFYSKFATTLPAVLQPDAEPKSEYISKTLFEDPEFRTWMSRYTVDVYAPAQEWNPGETKTYGLSESDEANGLPALSNHLAKIFDSFLPVDEPKTTRVKITSGIYEGCYQLQYVTDSHDKVIFAPLNGLDKNRDQVKVGQSTQGYPCFPEHPNNPHRTGKPALSNPNVRGDIYNPIVLDSKGNPQGIMYFNVPNYRRIQKALGEKIIFEVATWFLWGAAFKGLGYLWKGARALMAASQAAAKASSGFKMARFSSKFSNVWKLSTRGWETEMGLVNVTKNGDQIFVEMARPGYQGRMMQFSTEVLGGNSIKSLKGRILLRRAIQRDVIEGGASRTFGNTLTKAEQRIVASEKAVVDAVKEDLASMPQSFRQSLDEGTGALYRPDPAEDLLIDLNTGVQETVSVNPLTGNITGDISGIYQGTIITPYVQNPAAYNIAAGMSTVPSARLTGRVIYNQFPVLQELNGLTKFVLGMTALDQPVYNWYVKPYMTDFAQRQDRALASETGYDPSKAQQPTGPKTVLEQIQGLTPAEDTFGSTLQGAFLGVNQLLNYVLPEPVQAFRRGLFGTVTNISSAIDEPIADALGMGNNRFLPLPGAVLSMPFVFAGDPTPTYSDAARTQYEVMAHEQQVEAAMEQHNSASFKQLLDNELQALEEGLDTFLTVNGDMLKALSKSRKEIKQMYRAYEQALKAAKRQVDTDLEKAQEAYVAASQKFVDTQAEIMIRVAKAYVAQEAASIPEVLATYRQAYLFYFDAATEEQYTQAFNQYYAQREADLIAFYTALQVASRTHQNPQTLQAQAQQAIEQHNAAFTAKLEAMDTELNNRIEVRRNINTQKQNDYFTMCPFELTQFLPEDQAQLRGVFAEFNAQVQELFAQVSLPSADLQTKYEQLAVVRDARFAEVKAYLIANHPEYEALFEKTISVAIQERRAAAQAEEGTPAPVPAPAQ